MADMLSDWKGCPLNQDPVGLDWFTIEDSEIVKLDESSRNDFGCNYYDQKHQNDAASPIHLVLKIWSLIPMTVS